MLLSVDGVISAKVTHVDNAPGTAEVVCSPDVKPEDLTAAVRGWKATVKKP
jgi:hypothetical protein